MNRTRRFTPEQVAKAIGVQLKDWPGNCYGIASLMVDKGVVTDGVAVYGHWLGQVHPKSMFYPKWHAIRFCQHGWIRLDSGEILDPTRYVFEHIHGPYIYEGNPDDDACSDFDPSRDDDNDCETCGCVDDEHEQGGFFRPCMNCRSPYDEGGNAVREALMSPYPTEQTGNVYDLEWTPLAREVVCALTGRDPNGDTVRWSARQLMWVANLPPRRFGDAAEDVYRAIVKAGHQAFIPQDNHEMILGSTRRKKKAARQ
jgi:hypothetical protein